MKIKYKYQKFQADAARAVVDVFAGQPYMTNSYLIDRGDQSAQTSLRNMEFTGWSNTPIIPELSDAKILRQLQEIQRANGLKPSDQLEKTGGSYNLTIEMETGVGKTYTYIKTIFELKALWLDEIYCGCAECCDS